MKQKFALKIVLVIGILLLVTKGFSQDAESPGTLVTDRPDQTESSSLVTKGFIQVETGGFYIEEENDAGFTTETLGYNTTLIRYGLLDNLELRLGADNAEKRFEQNGQELENTLNGFSPLLLGVKVGIAEEDGLLPKIAVLGHLFLPLSASTDYRPETTGANFRFLFSHTLNERSSFSYNFGGRWGNDSPELAYEYTIVYGYSLTDTLGFYAELYGDFPEDSSANHLWDAGFTYLLSNNVQLDATVGTGFNTDQNLLVSAGVSFRLPR